jgi:hypothetical protein
MQRYFGFEMGDWMNGIVAFFVQVNILFSFFMCVCLCVCAFDRLGLVIMNKV